MPHTIGNTDVVNLNMSIRRAEGVMRLSFSSSISAQPSAYDWLLTMINMTAAALAVQSSKQALDYLTVWIAKDHTRKEGVDIILGDQQG